MENSKEKKTKSNPLKMKIFQTSQKHLATTGISPTLAMQPLPFNGRILMGFVILNAIMICDLVYISYDAKTFAEYTQAVYSFTTAVLIFSCLLVLIFKVQNIFEFFDSCDNLVNTSKCVENE